MPVIPERRLPRAAVSMKFQLNDFAVRALGLVALLLCASPAAAVDDSIEAQLRVVEQRIDGLKDQGETADSNAALQAYQEALNQLQEARRFEQLAAQFESDQSTAAQDETEIRERLASTSSRESLPGPAELEQLSWEALNRQATKLRDSLQSLLNKRDSLDQQIAAEAANAESIRARFNVIDTELASLPESHARIETTGVPSQFEATQWQLSAQHRKLNAERMALNSQLANQPARSRARRAQREEWVRNIEWLQQDLRVIDQYLADKRPTQTDEVLAQATPGTDLYALLQQLAAENAELTEHRSQLAAALSRADAEKTRTDSKLFELMEHFNSARRLVDSGGNASVYGPFLMDYFMRLDQYRPPSKRYRQSNEISEIVLARARHEQQQADLLDSRQLLNSKLEEMSLPSTATVEWVQTARPLLEERHKLLTELLSSETELLQLLGKTDISYEQLGPLVVEFRAFLIGHILWVRSHLPLDKDFFKQLVLDLRRVQESVQASMKFSGRKLAIVLMLAGLLLLLLRRRMWRQIEAINSNIGRPRNDSILFSLQVLLLTLLRSAAVPLVMVGMAFGIENSQQGLLQPLALTLLLSAAGVMVALFLRDATAQGGLCRVHFGWAEERCKGVSTLMSWILVRLMPMVILSSFVVHVERNTPHAVLGRLFLIVVAIMLAMRLRRFLARQRQNRQAGGIAPWLQDSLLIGATGALVAVILSGFLLPTRIIYYSVAVTALAIVALVLLHEMLMRWLLVTRRRIRFQGLLANLPDSAEVEKADTEARQASLGDISDSTANLIKSLVYASGIVAVVLIWAPLLPAIQGLQRFSLWTVTQTVNGEQLQTHITLATLVLAALVFVVTFYAARRIPALIELIMRSSGRSTPSGRYTVATITNYIIIAIGIMVFFSTLKLSWSQLQWLVAALGVGIGFGLQEIVANFISGLIILFERPIRVGDVVTIGQSEGTVTRIQIRATTIRDWDGKELLVPNKEFITGRLLNWTLSDTNNRITLEVGVAYGTDVKQAMKILEDVINRHPAILRDPAPNILFTKFGDSALLLSVRCFLADLEDRLRKVSALNQEIYEEFNNAGIVIAFPQLDVHLDPDSPLTVRLHREPAEPVSD
jgi:potassium efflux system protein